MEQPVARGLVHQEKASTTSLSSGQLRPCTGMPSVRASPGKPKNHGKAPAGLLERANLVTEITPLRYLFREQRVKAQLCIEF